MAATASGPNRWLVAAAGTIVMIALGTAYAWSNFTQPLVASFGWSASETTLTFGLAIFFIGIGALITGMLDLDSGLLLSIVRTAHITGAAAVLASTAMLAIEYRRSLPFTPE